MAEHRIEPERRTLHGHFSRELPPILTVSPGDVVEVRTLDARWNLDPAPDPFAAPAKFSPRDPELDRGHALCGPIAVSGARPGMTLVVRLEAIEDLDEAAVMALDGMLNLMAERHGMSRKRALALASLVVQLRVTQVVNGVRGVHALLPTGALEGAA